jgi:hypothetical protein
VQKKARHDEKDGDERGTMNDSKQEEKEDGDREDERKDLKNEKKERHEMLTPAPPGAAKRQKEMRLEGKRTVSELLRHGMTQGTATGVSGQVYVVDHAQSKILSLIGMDASMIVTLAVTKELMTSVDALLKEWVVKNEDVPPLIEFEGGKLRTGDGQPNTHVRIELEPGAVVKLAAKQDGWTSGCDAGRFDGSHFVTVFAGLSACAPPFTLTTEGVIYKFANSGPTGRSQGFYLQDENADVMKFLAFGAWADSEVLKVGNHVRIFFAKAQFGRGDYAKHVTLWLFDDSYVHVIGSNQPLQREGKTIALGD